MKVSYLVVFTLFLVLCGPSYATIYKWVDSRGQVHYTDDPKKIPENYKENAKDFDKIEKKGSVTYDPALGASTPKKSEGEPFWRRFLKQEEERAKAEKEHKVILYMADW